MNEVEELKYAVLKNHFEMEAKMLGLEADYKIIHSAQTINEFEFVSEEVKKQYCNLIGEDYKDDAELFKLKLKNAELLRMHNYVYEVLFNQRESIIDYTFMFYNVLAPEDVRKKGIDFYYFQAGSLTMEDLIERYSKFELLFMCAFMSLFVEEPFVADMYCSKEGLVMNLLSIIDDAKMDYRNVITMYGPFICHNNVDCNLRTVSDLYTAANRIGIDVNQYPEKKDLYKHYCLFQVNPSLFKEVDNFRAIDEQVKNAPEAFEDYLYYGYGDGFSPYMPVKKTELPEFIAKNHMSKPLIRKCIYILQKENGKYQAVVEKLYDMLNVVPKISLPKASNELKVLFVNMFNSGSMLYEFESELKSFNPYDYDLRLHLEPTIPEYTNRFRVNIKSILQELDQFPKEIGKLQMVEMKDNNYQYLEGFEYSLINFFLSLERMEELGMSFAISLFGKELMATANFYHYKYFNYFILQNTLEIDNIAGNPLELNQT